MTLQIEFWHLLSLLIAVLGAMYGMHKHGMDKTEKHQALAHKQVLSRLDAMERVSKEEATQWQRIEREMLQLKADMPLHYVRREDYIRGQSVIEAKLDALYTKLEMAQLRAAKTGAKDAH